MKLGNIRILCGDPCLISFPFLPCRMEDEAVLDRGAYFVKHVCEEEVEGKMCDENWSIIDLREALTYMCLNLYYFY